MRARSNRRWCLRDTRVNLMNGLGAPALPDLTLTVSPFSSAMVASGHDDLMSSPPWGSRSFSGIRCRPVFSIYKPRIEVSGSRRPGANHREQRPMDVEMAVVNRLVNDRSTSPQSTYRGPLRQPHDASLIRWIMTDATQSGTARIASNRCNGCLPQRAVPLDQSVGGEPTAVARPPWAILREGDRRLARFRCRRGHAGSPLR